MQLVINRMIEYVFFKEPKSLTDVAKHLYIDGKPEEKVLEVVLGDLVKAREIGFNDSQFKKISK